MNKIISLLCIFLLIIALTGCPVKETIQQMEEYQQEQEFFQSLGITFTQVGEGPYCKIYVCDQTRVLYAVSASSRNWGSYTVLVNPDGSPMTLEGN